MMAPSTVPRSDEVGALRACDLPVRGPATNKTFEDEIRAQKASKVGADIILSQAAVSPAATSSHRPPRCNPKRVKFECQEMKTVLVTGGTGHLGRDLVRHLVSQGRTVRLFSLKPGTATAVQWAQGNLATGEGLVEAMRGVDTVLHAATFSPIARRGVRLTDFFASPSTVDVDGTRRLLEVSDSARVAHFLFVSIVGLDDTSYLMPALRWRVKRLVRESPLPWSVVRATGFYYLVAQMLSGLRWLPIWPLPTAPTGGPRRLLAA